MHEDPEKELFMNGFKSTFSYFPLVLKSRSHSINREIDGLKFFIATKRHCLKISS